MISPFQNQIFTVVEFEPSNIVLQHIKNRKLYRYEEINKQQINQVNHQIILKAEPFCSGFVYQKQVTNLAKYLMPKFISQNKDHFEENQLYNTFEPILNFLKSGNIYTGISLETILMDKQGNMKLKDPRINRNSSNFQNDFQRLAHIIIQCALLKELEEQKLISMTKQQLSKILKRFSLNFITNIWILLKQSTQLAVKINFSSELSNNQQHRLIYQQFENILKNVQEKKQKIDLTKIFATQQKKIIVIPPLNLKFNNTRKPDSKKINLSGKKRSHNQNENQESTQKKIINPQGLQKMINSKCLNKNTEIKLKIKKLQLIDNFKSPLKRRGKTIDKRNK